MPVRMQNRRGEGMGFGPVTRPGKSAGDCPECGNSTVMVGYDTTVVGMLCEACDLFVGIGVEYVDVHDAFDDPHPPGEPAPSPPDESE